MAQAFSAVIALGTAFVSAPLIAWFTNGKYYIARHEEVPGGAQFAAGPPLGKLAPSGAATRAAVERGGKNA